MASFPRIDSPCPLRFEKMPGAAGFDCSHCHRHVHNLSAMTDHARQVFLAGCDESICVAYTAPSQHTKAAAWLLAASVGAMSSAALAATDTPPGLSAALSGNPVPSPSAPLEPKPLDASNFIVMGGVNNPRTAEQVDFSIDRAPELPVVIDAEPVANLAVGASRPAQDATDIR